MRSPASLVTAGALLLALGACKPTYVRDTDVKGLDDAALSTRLDRADLDRLLAENTASLKASALWATWSSTRPIVAIFPIENETSEHIESQMDALLSRVETVLVNEGGAQVVDQGRQRQLIHDAETRRGGAYDPASAPRYGKQLGASFYVTGKLSDNTERSGGERRVQYFLFMRVLEVETGAIRWQNESKLTKGLVQ